MSVNQWECVLAAQGVVYIFFGTTGAKGKLAGGASAHRRQRKHKFAIKNFPQHCPGKKK